MNHSPDCQGLHLTRRAQELLCLAVAVLITVWASGCLAPQAPSSGELRTPLQAATFRLAMAARGATVHVVFASDKTYQIIAQMRGQTVPLDWGNWQQDNAGVVLLASTPERKTSHVKLVTYRALVVLASADCDVIREISPSPESAATDIDTATAAGHTPELFILIGSAGDKAAARTPQPFFLFH